MQASRKCMRVARKIDSEGGSMQLACYGKWKLKKLLNCGVLILKEKQRFMGLIAYMDWWTDQADEVGYVDVDDVA